MSTLCDGCGALSLDDDVCDECGDMMPLDDSPGTATDTEGDGS